jgi:hypothetical protein
MGGGEVAALYVEVLAEADTARGGVAVIELSHSADTRLMAIGSDDEAGVDCLAVGVDDAVGVCGGGEFDVLYYGLPVEADSEGSGAVDEKLMEDGTAHPSTIVMGEVGLGGDG